MPKRRPSSNGFERRVTSRRHFTLYAYGAVQVWAQAAEKAGSLELQAMIAAMREHQFDTVLGPIDFDDKGDIIGLPPVWLIWRGGNYMPLEPSP